MSKKPTVFGFDFVPAKKKGEPDRGSGPLLAGILIILICFLGVAG